MTNGSWTPAPRGGLIPLHPLGFGTILGRSFAALRGNPKVLLGFAVGVQFISSILLIVAVGGVALWAFARLDTVPAGSEEWQTIAAGSALITNLTGLVFGLVLGAVALLVQAVVVGEVASSALGEKATFGRIWARAKGRIWALVGYALLLGVIIGGIALVVFGAIALLGFLLPTAGMVAVGFLTIVAIPGFLVLFVWLYTKLYVVAPAIVLERAGVFTAMKRSWTLTRGRFWPTFGIYVLLTLILGSASSIVVYPLGLLGGLIGSIFAPTGGEEQAMVIAIVAVGVAAIAAFLIQCVTMVVQATSAVLVYLDLRMRREGIDLKMQRYIEARDAGAYDLPDPYAYDPNDVAPPRAADPAFVTYQPPAMGSYGAHPGYGQPQQPYPTQQPYGAQRPYQAQQPYGAPQPSPAQPPYPAPQPYPAPAPPYSAQAPGASAPVPPRHDPQGQAAPPAGFPPVPPPPPGGAWPGTTETGGGRPTAGGPAAP